MTDFFEFRAKVTAAQTKGSSTVIPAAGSGPMSVAQLAKQVEECLKAGFPYPITVRGELSNVNLHKASGHLYFTLKDNDASIDGVMWKAQAAALKFRPADGMEVIITGSIKSYARSSKYQIYATRVEPVGQGALELALRQLREKLAGEGLLDADRKRPVPAYPRHVALVTAQRTAALADMLKVLGRFPQIRISVCHAAVQGASATREIADALSLLSSAKPSADLPPIDVVILGRGGGSLEDLWSFNEEPVARAIVASRMPVVTGIGHEIDTHIADLVADHHAHTPTAAAEFVCRYWRITEDKLDTYQLALPRLVRRYLERHRTTLEMYSRHECFRRPLDAIRHFHQRLDDNQRRLQAAAGRRLDAASRTISQRALRLERVSPAAQVGSALARLDQLSLRLHRAADTRLREVRAILDGRSAQLKLIGPEQVLARGYSLTTIERTGAIVRGPADVRPGDLLITKTARGDLRSTVGTEQQGDLFG